MAKYSAAVIGGGAAGICSAINLGRRGESVVICEKMSQIGKKLLATGNGRCNLLNDDLNETHYNPAARELVKSVFEQFGKNEILGLFQDLGLQVYSQDGRIFPVTNQAATVLKVLEMELKRLSVPIEFNFDCSGISFSENSILVSSSDRRKIECHKLIITGGGKTYPAFGSDGSMYKMARQLGHALIEPVPAVVPLVVKDNLCQVLQGQRIPARARSIIEGKAGQWKSGELLFAKYGLSGTCILDISEDISIAINRSQCMEVFVAVDMVPFMEKEQLNNELEKRRKANWTAEEMLVGILPNKISSALKYLWAQNDISRIVDIVKEKRFKVSGTRSWNEAEFTCGGIEVNEIKLGTLESEIRKDIYFAGEILDVNGGRGGYNLGWAWASGWVAGKTQ